MRVDMAEKRTEMIGKVRLDYSKYLGEDMYCDGAVEDELLDIVANHAPAEYEKKIKESRSWPILYHLSPLRANIIDWVPMTLKPVMTSKPVMTLKPVMTDNSVMTGVAASEPAFAGEASRAEAAGGETASGGGEDTEKNAASPANDISKGENGAADTKIPWGQGTKVLEVGSGCGALTGALSRKAGSVTCVDLSKKRSRINAYRNRECGNVVIHVGNFKDIEPELPRDYDYICLIGVFEYGKEYIGGDTPYEDFLKMLLPHLAEGGRILIAIENRYGMKYFAGCKEDHLGTWFSGIENYRAGGGVRTFSRSRLEQIFRDCGVGEYHFYYPYPDYKFMSALYSDEYLPAKGELSDNIRNFDRDRMLLFDEKSAFDGVIEDGLFSIFANSYMVVIGEGFDIKYAKFSNERAPEYAVRTQIADGPGRASVRKYPLTAAAQDHIRGMAAACESLRERYQGGNLEINKCRLVEEDDVICAEFEYVRGIPLSALMDKCLEKRDFEGFYRYVREYVKRLGYNKDFPAADFDPMFSNILVDGDTWTLIDYEWTFGKPIDTKELVFRAVNCYLREDVRRKSCNQDILWKELGITQAEADYFLEQEQDFQRFVAGSGLSLAEVRGCIGCQTFDPKQLIEGRQVREKHVRIQVYEDRGEGFGEEASYFVEDACWEEEQVEFELDVEKAVKNLRIDPAFEPCAVKLLALTLNGERVPLQKKKLLDTNGWIQRPAEKGEIYCPTIAYATEDPHFTIDMSLLDTETENRLKVRMEVAQLPLSIARDVAAPMKQARGFGRKS